MYSSHNGCWVRSPTSLLCLSQHSGSLGSTVLSHQLENKEEDEEQVSVVCHYTPACDEHAAGAQWCGCDPQLHSGISNRSGLTMQGPSTSTSQQIAAMVEADQRHSAHHFVGACCGVGAKMETQGCVCVYGQREPQRLGSCCSGHSYIYHGPRRNIVVGVEVVEEVAVEEVITEDIYEDDLMDFVELEDNLVYPT